MSRQCRDDVVTGVLAYPAPSEEVHEIMEKAGFFASKQVHSVSPAMVAAGVSAISADGLPQSWEAVEILVTKIYVAMQRAAA